MISRKLSYRVYLDFWRLRSWIVSLLPKWVIYEALIRAGAYASCGKYSGQIVPDLTLMDTLKRWGEYRKLTRKEKRVIELMES